MSWSAAQSKEFVRRAIARAGGEKAWKSPYLSEEMREAIVAREIVAVILDQQLDQYDDLKKMIIQTMSAACDA